MDQASVRDDSKSSIQCVLKRKIGFVTKLLSGDPW